MKYCADCGNQNDDNAIFCSNCGIHFGSNEKKPQEEDIPVYEGEVISNQQRTNPNYQQGHNQRFSGRDPSQGFPKIRTQRLNIVVWIMRILAIFIGLGIFAAYSLNMVNDIFLIQSSIYFVSSLYFALGLARFNKLARKIAIGFGILIIIFSILAIVLGIIPDPITLGIYIFVVHTLHYHKETRALFVNDER